MIDAGTAVPVLVDAHQLGLQETGNETWIRNVLRHLGNVQDLDVIVSTTDASDSDFPSSVRLARVSKSNLKRLLVDLPRRCVSSRAEVLLAQNVLPPWPLRLPPTVLVVHDL